MSSPSLREQISERVKNLFDTGFVLIDLETTGLPHHSSVEIIEIGVINHQGEVLLNSLIKPRWPIPAQASAVNGLYDADVANAPLLSEIYPQLLRIVADQTAVAFNSDFEESILEIARQREGLPHLMPQAWYCSMRAYRAFYGARHRIGLGRACSLEGITVENAHRAIGDCQLTLALMHKMAAG